MSGYYPEVSAYYSYKYEWSLLPGGGNDYVFGLSLELPFFDWGITGSKASEAEYIAKESAAAADNAKITLQTKYDAAVSGYTAELEKKKIFADSLKNADNSLRIYEKRYKNALCSSDELLDAQKLYSTAQNDYENTLLLLRMHSAEIARIKGE